MSRPLPAPARFAPYRAIGSRPNIVVDGAPLPSTVLTLSHWPNNQTPDQLKRDTSTATAFAYLDEPRLHCAAPLVTNSHFDEDGLFSMFAVSSPRLARRYRELLLDGASAGDFGVFRRREAARLVFAVESLTDPVSSPLPAAVFSRPDRVAALYEAMLPLLPDLLARLGRYRRHWAAQDEHLAASERWLAAGLVVIEERPDLDLAIVHIPEQLPDRSAHRYLRAESCAVHPFAINCATRCTRILRVQGGRLDFQYRYESWVQLASRRPALRVDLRPLARRLTRLEAGAARWVAEPVTEVAPRLYREPAAAGRVSWTTLWQALSRVLRTEVPAWDPYDWRADPAA